MFSNTTRFTIYSERNVAVPTRGLRVFGMRARRAWPQEEFDARQRNASDRLVPDVHRAIGERPVRRIRHHGRRHRVLGGARVGVRRRDQRARTQGHVGHVRQRPRRDRQFVGVHVRVFFPVENGRTRQLFGADRRDRGLVTGTATLLLSNIITNLF